MCGGGGVVNSRISKFFFGGVGASRLVEKLSGLEE